MFRKGTKVVQCVSIIVFISLFITACGGLQSKIVGRWEWIENPSVVYEFFEDNVLLITTPNGNGSATYDILEDGRIRINYKTLFGRSKVTVYEVVFEGDQMTLLGDDGDTFRRAK